MAFIIKFRNKQTKQKWMEQDVIYGTISQAKKVGKLIKGTDPHIKTDIRIKKIDLRKKKWR